MPTPDELHEEYYRLKPQGNHTEPSPETLRFMEEQLRINNKVSEDITEIKVTLERIETVGNNVLAQTTKTNGRVSRLEDFEAKAEPIIQAILEDREVAKEKKMVWYGNWVQLFVTVVLAGGIMFIFQQASEFVMSKFK